MSYQVLARKWRPRSFDTLIGQDHVVRALTHALEQQRLHHAYLFTGTRGVGKTTIARILAKSLNCDTGITAKPCGVCAACTEIDAGRFVDYVEMDAASNRSVDDMAALLEKAAYAPARGRYKVYMIDEVHMLTGHAFNAMLKTLEEPPEHVKFILATTDPQKIPVTVLSRCLQFNLKQMQPDAIVRHLASVLDAEQVEYEPAALRPISKGAAGSMRDALSLLDQAIAHGAGRLIEQDVLDMLGTVGDEHLYLVLDAIIAGDGTALMALTEQMRTRSVDFDQALRELAVLLHRVAMAQRVPDAITDENERLRLAPYVEAMDAESVQLAYQIVVQGCNDLPMAPDELTGFSMTLLRLLAFRPDNPPPLAATPRGHSAALQAPPRVARASAPLPPVVAPTPVEREPLAQVPAPRHKEAPSAFPAAVVPSTVPTEAKAGAAVLHSNEDWHALVDRLDIVALTRQLAHQCEWLGSDGGRIRLRLPREMAHLVSSAQDKLRAAVQDALGMPVQLQFEHGAPVSQTVAQRLTAEQQAREQQAREAMRNDPFVQQVIEQFDARLIEDSIKPL
ncbi:DNA polymerase III subunit gamma/tau [Methyloversatilis sp.]|uniref:DNA polymerase III subunit gamma/tau n=1 Tax=Methyloversatilis sp. TaxID=2569862 RepID=UPI0027363514|nr:DNA polymerase III subunit gamma/tau [Methyloversatilis sp.]MDP2869044.1 DNA polymerase III subunit gamma/tau [Methyloversatilis sp.]MDP3455380.1 DNA polymerase III subunit gamma/tau [Methyloversatilis sp.]MDP3578553.1 DNA polymerase III subunit gamma/tau [Methyloversatilis sp.]